MLSVYTSAKRLLLCLDISRLCNKYRYPTIWILFPENLGSQGLEAFAGTELKAPLFVVRVKRV